MTQLTKSAQLSPLFALIRSALVANSVLSPKFNLSRGNIVQFEPKHKASNFIGFPYIWINFPDSTSSKVTLNNSVTQKDFEVPMFLRMEWDARDNVSAYIDAIIHSIEGYEDTFQVNGYYEVDIDLVNVDSDNVIEQKQIVQAEFTLSFRAQVGA